MNKSEEPFRKPDQGRRQKGIAHWDVRKPLITLHGTLDALLPITKSSDKYAELVEGAGKGHLHYYYKIEGGTHIDALYEYPDPRGCYELD